MDSLKAFLSTCELINDEKKYRPGNLTIILQNLQPARVFDKTGQTRPFEIARIADPDSLTHKDIAELLDKGASLVHIIVLNHPNQVCGVIEPERLDELQIAIRATIQKGELGTAIISPPPNSRDEIGRHLLREWWHQTLRDHGRYRCYAFFLCLQSDHEAVKYITKFGKELDNLSNNNCLVIALSNTEFRRSGHDETAWKLAVHEQSYEGYSTTVADLLKIKYTDFPCVVFFEDMRSPKRVVFHFNKELEAEEIAEQMRRFFTAIQDSERPISALERLDDKERIKKARQSIFNWLSPFFRKTFEIAMEAWINVSLKQ